MSQSGKSLYQAVPDTAGAPYLALRMAMDDFCVLTKELSDDLHSADAIADLPTLLDRHAQRNAKRGKLRAKAVEGKFEDLLAIIDHDASTLSPLFEAKLAKAAKKGYKVLRDASAGGQASGRDKKAESKDDDSAASNAPHRVQSCLIRWA